MTNCKRLNFSGFYSWAAAVLALVSLPAAEVDAGMATTGASWRGQSMAVSARSPRPVENGLLWKVERAGIKPSYVFGTIQSEDPRVAELADSVIDAFRRADAYAMEMIPDGAAVKRMSDAMFLPPEQTLPQLVGEGWFTAAASLMSERGVSPEILARLKPWVVSTALSVPRSEDGLFLDVLLFAAAVHDGKNVHGLETADEQLAVLESLSAEDQVSVFKGTVMNHRRIAEINDRLVSLYAAGDLAAIAALDNESTAAGDDPALAERVRSHRVDARSQLMVERMLPHIEEQNVFIAVDAVNLAGDRGVLRLLEQRGYTVSPVR